jgi:hypothetical protein
LAAPRVIGNSKRGARLRSPVLRTIGTRSRPLLVVQSTVFLTGSAAMGIVGSAPQVSPMSNSENPFASLRVSIPSPVTSINNSASASGQRLPAQNRALPGQCRCRRLRTLRCHPGTLRAMSSGVPAALLPLALRIRTLRIEDLSALQMRFSPEPDLLCLALQRQAGPPRV